MLRRANQTFTVENPDGPGHVVIAANEPVPASIAKKLGADSVLLHPTATQDRPKSTNPKTSGRKTSRK
ncbi:MAG: hypothetical protein GY939_10870 [Actinomycetia bacterium]|nr:hypothetical protein [Actinomycetes bacterium]